jgi:methylmalonyl-CoA/ethylmalonyl-CoA epimerase
MADPRLHHVGFVVESVEASAPAFARSIGAATVSQVFHDPLQRVDVLFLYPPGSPAIELISPPAVGGSASPVTSFLARGGGLHHICYEVSDLDQQISEMQTRRALVVRPPKPAVAFEGRRIAWVITAEKLLIEYVESDK